MIQIRLSNEYDSGVIVGFQKAMAKETEGINLDSETVKEGVLSVFRDPQKGRYFVATDDDKVVGSLMLTPEWSDWRNCWVMWIQSVYILPEYRQKGIFRKMYKYILDHEGKSRDVSGIRLYVDKTNKRAISVYEKLGMNGEHYQLFEWMKK
jgi:ribosomal protein S18 acetylase RimI-like enzyme